jgi:hydrogenase expression/formation protein HypC
MCLALPGRIEERIEGPSGLPFARVRFGAVAQDVCLSFVPDAAVGEYVIVHVGFAIQRLDAAEAERTLALLAGAPPVARAGEEPA